MGNQGETFDTQIKSLKLLFIRAEMPSWSASSVEERELDRLFKTADGPSWRRRSNWKKGTEAHLREGVTMDDTNKLSKLILDNNLLAGVQITFLCSTTSLGLVISNRQLNSTSQIKQ